jgi:hypothetical protein
MSESLHENLVELALSVDEVAAIEALMKRDPELLNTDGPRFALRQAIIDVALALDAIEQREPELYDSVDWFLVIDHLAGQINRGRTNVNMRAALKAGGR